MFFWALPMILAAWGWHHPLRSDAVATRIEIYKARRELLLFHADGVITAFPVALGPAPVGHKAREGDGATPEGTYFICRKNPQSQYHLSLGISYPGPKDAEQGHAAGLISAEERDLIVRRDREGLTPPWKTALGGEIFIHGGGAENDWTLGCVALRDADIERIFALVPVGIPVVIHP